MRGLKSVLLLTCLLNSAVFACTEESLKNELAEFFSGGSVGASVLIGHGDKVLCSAATGLADLSLNVPMTTEHLFEIGSLTKQVTAVGILLLAQDGKLSLDDAISTYISAISSDKGTVTIKHLLSHTSGLVDPINEPDFLATRVQESITLNELVAMFKQNHWQYQPGERIVYSNVGYSMLAYIIEKVSGKTYWDYLNTAVLTPLGMRNTYRAGFDIIPNKVTGHTFTGNTPRHHDFLNLNWAYGAADLVSNTSDLHIFSHGLMTGKLLTPIFLETLLAPIQLNESTLANGTFNYSLSEVNGKQIIRMSGSTLGNSSHSIYIPDSQTYIVVLNNSDGVNGGAWVPPATIAGKLAANILDVLLPSFETVQHTAQSANKYVGDYKLPSNDIRKLTYNDGQFFFQRNDGVLDPVVAMKNDGFFFADTLSYFYIRDVGKQTQSMDFYYLLSTTAESAAKE